MVDTQISKEIEADHAFNRRAAAFCVSARESEDLMAKVDRILALGRRIWAGEGLP
jgi:hypothetical protein